MRSSTSPVVELLGDLRKTFDALELRWFVFGAQAAVLHGAARLTADVDVTVDARNVPASAIVREASRHGFAAQIPNKQFIELTRVIPLLHSATRLPVDLVLAGPGLEDLFLGRATEYRLGRVRVPVASLEDLVAMKLISGRPKDLEDVDALLSARMPDVNVAQIHETLSLAESLLDQSDLVRALEERLRRLPDAGGRTVRPRRKKKSPRKA